MRSMGWMVLICYTLALVSGCAAGRSFSAGQGFEDQGKYEEAMYSYAEALKNAPDSMEYRLRFLSAREKAANDRYKKGTEKYEKGDFSSALIDFQTAYGLDPSQERYKQLIEDTLVRRNAQDAFQDGVDFERANKLKDALRMYNRAVELRPGQKEYKSAASRLYKTIYDKPSGFDLNLKSTKPFAFKLSGTGVKNAFRILTQLSGINFVFDEGVKDQPVSVNLEKASFQQVLDLLTSMNKLGRTILNDGTVVIYPKSPEKVKQYESMRLRTFHLDYMDAKKAINLIRSVLQVRKIHVNEETNSIVVRDTNDVVSVIEKLLDANDVPEAEVLLDIEVLEVTDSNVTNVGLVLSRYAVDFGLYGLNKSHGTYPANGVASPFTIRSPGSLMADTLSSTTDSTTTPNTLSNLLKVFSSRGYGAITVPNATYNFGKTVSKGEVLSNPKIRVKNKEKAKFTVGQRVPITTTSTTAGVAGVSINVQYIDVGVKVNVEPTIQLNNEVDLKMNVEVSSILSKDKVGNEGTVVATIGTRNLETVLSLKDGETSVIGGLISKTETDSKQKVFLIGDIPLIGPLLSGNSIDNNKGELILAITPRLIRGVTVPPKNISSFMSGREDEPQLEMLPSSAEEDTETKSVARPMPPQNAVMPPAGGMQAPVQPVPVQPRGAVPPGQSQGAVQPIQPPGTAMPGQPTGAVPPLQPTGGPQPVTQAPMPTGINLPATNGPSVSQPMPIDSQPPVDAAPMPGTQAPAANPAPGVSSGSGTIRMAAPAMASMGQTFPMNVLADNVQNIISAPFILTYDPAMVEPVSVAAGTLINKNGVFSRSIDTKGGTVSVNLVVKPGSPGITGSGVLANVVFRSRKKGQAVFGLRDAGFRSADGKPVSLMTFNAAVDIR